MYPLDNIFVICFIINFISLIILFFKFFKLDQEIKLLKEIKILNDIKILEDKLEDKLDSILDLLREDIEHRIGSLENEIENLYNCNKLVS